ncbi:MAG TPA: O-antigen ligase family protein [bacterium]|nr:O-antigen ligase family protein [bacterium]
MLTFLLIIYCLLFIFLALKNFKWTLYLVIFTLPAYLIRFNIFGLPLTLLEIEIVLLCIVFLIKNYNKLKITNYSLLFYSTTLFVIAATISVFVSPNPYAAAGTWKAYFIEPILFCLVFIKTIKKEDLKNIIYILSAQVFLLSIFAIYQKFTGAFITNPFWATAATRRVTSVFPYPNALALYLAPLLTLFLGYFIFEIKNSKLFQNSKLKIQNYLPVCYQILIIISGTLAIYFTKSKGALFGLLFGIIFYAIFYKPYRKYFIALLGIVALLSFYLIGAHKINLSGTSTVSGGDSISVRTAMWSETWEMLKQQPWLGAGLAGYQSAVAPFHKKSYIEIYLYPHNIILNFWSEIGLLGLSAFIAIIVWFYKTGFFCHPRLDLESRKPAPVHQADIKIIFLSAMTALLIHGLVDAPYFKNDLAILFWLIIGLLIVSPTNIKNYSNHNS